ncbi:hypothetical protein G9A89_012810 [Geosiphon pyriformis]|nr:hypothetical protein G9A89_012810 [Geosiphon pyriformis]
MILISKNINNITQQLVESLQQLKSDLEITRNTSGNCKDSLREDPRQWVDFSSASEKEYINTHNNQELKNNLHRNSKKKAFSVTHYIFNLVRDKDLSVSWIKVKGHSGIHGNMEANLAAGAASGSPFSLCANVYEHFLVAEGVAISGNACHFVRNIFWSVCCAHWEAGSGCNVVLDAMIGCIDWVVMTKVWHLDSHMLTGFTSQISSTLHTYIMKAVHRKLPVVVRKSLYDKCYPSVLCLFCGGVEFSDHAFTCVHEFGICGEILAEASAHWSALAGGSLASAMLQVLSQCSFDVRLYTLVCKGFEACSIFEDKKVATTQIVDYVVMEKAGLVCDSGVVSGLSCSVSSVLSDDVVRLLGMANFFAVSFGYQKSYCFFSGLGGSVQVIIGV